MEFAQGHALLIGVGSYRHAPGLNVPSTVEDARAVAEVLRDPRLCGYPAAQIAAPADATREAVLAGLDELAGRAGADHTVFLLYSGHGHYDQDSEYCLTTADTRLTPGGAVVSGSAVSQRELLAALQRIRARRVLLIFNACHAGELSPTLGGAEPPGGRGLPEATSGALLATGEGRAIVTACRQRQYSFVGRGDRTIFGQALVDGLRGVGSGGAGGIISVFDLYTHLFHAVGAAVQRDVPEATRRRYGGAQEPELTILKGVGPFAVALYQGGASLGRGDAPADAPRHAAVREVEPEQSRALLRQIQQARSISINVGTSSGIIIAENSGTVNYSPARESQGGHGPT